MLYEFNIQPSLVHSKTISNIKKFEHHESTNHPKEFILASKGYDGRGPFAGNNSF
jgi:hypothetical protein